MNRARFYRRAALCWLALLTLALSPALRAEHAPPQPRILVSGEGRAELVPDMAVLTLTVTR